MKPRVFFFHFNKPLSKAAKSPKISVHQSGTCHIVDNVDVRVPTMGKHNKRQPYFVMRGVGVVRVRQVNGQAVALITRSAPSLGDVLQEVA